MFSLANKHCIITGGSRGIGLAIAQLFASAGASCTLIGRDTARLSAAAKSLPLPLPHGTESAAAQGHKTHAFDVASGERWEEFVRDVVKSGRIDVLVNAAGISQNSFLFKTRRQDVEKLIDTNLKGAIWGCQTVIPKMMKQKSGCIVNVSSLLATHGGRGASVYAATKAGIVGLTRSLAWEVGRFGIRANVLLPGYIQTDMTRGTDDKGELSALIPLGRLGLAEEVAQAAVFLATNSYAHNCVLNIDGGLSAT
ncbi:Uu.00g069960.m01.CDS01 [Anthostomella pinea]|uniref:Uu.00g069960.m01.CDS01 n=1 Tax=Anthostomella pinea TaxID=933095 RepID=A0AAI8VUM6_9PEZI|nr:Uu.00g069960.m01.CDS01 [Anthostomella pinea]